jgi:hypothetical protein
METVFQMRSFHVAKAARIWTVVLLFFIGKNSIPAAEFVGGALRFDPPPLVGTNELTRAPSGMPFAGDALGVDCYTAEVRDGFGWLRLQFIWVGIPVRNGRRITYSLTTTNELRQFLEQQNLKYTHPLKPVTVDGFPGFWMTSTNASPRQRFHEATFIQVKTNIVLRMTVSAQNKPVFDTLVASLKTVKIDAAKLFAHIQPKPPKVTRLEASRIDMGFAPLGDRQVTAFVFHTKTGIRSIVSGMHFDQVTENEEFESLSKVLNDLAKISRNQSVRCRATVAISKHGSEPDEVQRNSAFHVVDEKLHPLRGIPSQKLEGLQPMGLSSVSDNGPPNGFRKVHELTFPLELVVEEHDDR